MHTPEFPFERDAGNVQRAIAQNGLHYPVAQDNDYATWDAWGNQYWPAKYLIDARGRVRYAHFGEGDYDKTESAIRALLAEAGAASAGRGRHGARVEVPSHGLATPETYLGYERAQGFDPPLRPGLGRYSGTTDLPPVHFSLAGTWKVTRESATAVARRGDQRARHRPQGVPRAGHVRRAGTRTARVLLDGRPVTEREAGEDVSGGRLTVGAQRLYRLSRCRASRTGG